MTWVSVRVVPGDDRDAALAALFAAGAQGVHEDGMALVTHFPPETDVERVANAVRGADPGADVEVPAVIGSVSLRLPAGTQSGQVFNLRGRGLPRVNATGVGDLHVRVQLWTPDKVAAEEESLLKQLAALRDHAPQTRSKGFWNKMKEVLGA